MENEASQVPHRMKTLKRYKRPANHWTQTLVSYKIDLKGCKKVPRQEVSDFLSNSFRNISWGDLALIICHKTKNNPENSRE